MQNPKKNQDILPGLYPVESNLNEPYEKAILYYPPNQLACVDHMNRFYDYLGSADPVRAFAVIANLYFDYGAMQPDDPDPIKDAEDRDEFRLLIQLFSGLAVCEHDHIKKDRDGIIEENYSDVNLKPQ